MKLQLSLVRAKPRGVRAGDPARYAHRARVSSIPKGLCPPAQGCDEGATLGQNEIISINSVGGCSEIQNLKTQYSGSFADFQKILFGR